MKLDDALGRNFSRALLTKTLQSERYFATPFLPNEVDPLSFSLRSRKDFTPSRIIYPPPAAFGEGGYDSAVLGMCKYSHLFARACIARGVAFHFREGDATE